MTRQFCGKKWGKNDHILGKIRYCVAVYTKNIHFRAKESSFKDEQIMPWSLNFSGSNGNQIE